MVDVVYELCEICGAETLVEEICICDYCGMRICLNCCEEYDNNTACLNCEVISIEKAVCL